MPQLITRKFIAEQIDNLLLNNISVRDFGEQMFGYLALANEEYKYEEGYEELIEEILTEFMEMHDADKGDVGYEPYIPSKEKLIQIKERLLKEGL